MLRFVPSPVDSLTPPFHGGRLRKASLDYDIPLSQWQDLSTGVSPWAYPVPVVLLNSWQQLPDDTELNAAAASFYGFYGSCCAVAGSQIAIREIPRLLSPSTVAIPAVGYQEHDYAWRSAGHTVKYFDSGQSLHALVEQQEVEHVVVINPNNPTAEFFEPKKLLLLKSAMSPSGLLLVDEAFIEGAQQPSLLNQALGDGIVVLRSIGKFFGLAGLRLGFALGDDGLISRLQRQVQPWGVSGAAIAVGISALQDHQWQAMQATRIQESSVRLQTVVSQHWRGVTTVSAGLFTTVLAPHDAVESRFEQAASNAVLLRKGRVNADLAWLRIGLADDYSVLNQSWATHKPPV